MEILSFEESAFLHKAAEYGIPFHMRNGLFLYVNKKVPPGSFLTSVLSNDLARACETADHVNRNCLFNYVNFLYNCVPIECWGSEEAVKNWLNS